MRLCKHVVALTLCVTLVCASGWGASEHSDKAAPSGRSSKKSQGHPVPGAVPDSQTQRRSVQPRNAHTRASTPGVVINSITIQPADVFDLKREGLNFFPYGWVNALHMTTKKNTVRKNLLFREGDVYNESILAESERRLRSFAFIRVADIHTTSFSKQKTDISVYTQDSWTLEPQVSYGGGGGVTHYAVGLKERNLFGWGKELGIFYTKNDEGEVGHDLFYNDAHIFPKFWALESAFSRRSNGSINHVVLKRPFYQLAAPWSVTTQWDNTMLEEYIYRDNESIATITERTARAGGIIRKKLFSTDETALRAGIGYTREEYAYTDLETDEDTIRLPSDRFFQGPQVSAQYLQYDYIATKNLNSFARVEDYNMGEELSCVVGYSPRQHNHDHTVVAMDIENSKGVYFDRDHFLLTKVGVTGDVVDATPNNLLFSGEGYYYKRFTERQTLAASCMISYIRNADLHNQLIMGGLNGLRGYPARQFVGNKSFILSVEDRITWLEEFLSLVGVGGVVFFDTGYAWPEGDGFDPTDLYSDIGVGLRFGLTRSSEGYVLRLDIAYALNHVPGEERLVISFGSRQSFQRAEKKYER